jgi:hypothetical protein
MEGGGRVTIDTALDFSDPESDIVSIHIQINNGVIDVYPVGSLPASSGTIRGVMHVSTELSGEFTARVWAIDSNGNESNRLTVIFSILGSTRLSELSISAGELDQIFQPTLIDYTATVSAAISTTTVSPATEDPTSTITVNGIEIPSGGTSDDITLNEGMNTITVVVTAVDSVTTETYTLEVTREAVEALSQRAYIKAPSPEGTPPPPLFGFSGFGDNFGASVAMDGNILAVGAWGDNVPGAGFGVDHGAVFVFVRDVAGVWSQEERLTLVPEADLDGEEYFGVNVALDEDKLFVSAIGSNPFSHGPSGAGRVVEFDRDEFGTWEKTNELAPTRSRSDGLSLFGSSVDADGSLLVVGAPNGNNLDSDPFDTGNRTGDAFLFERDGAGGWTQQLRFIGPSPDVNDSIGNAVAVHGDIVAIGVPGDDSEPTSITGDPSDNSVEDSGAVFVLRRGAMGGWIQEAFLKAPNGDAYDFFGQFIALSGDTLVVSAPGEDGGDTGINGNRADNSADGAGAVYVFKRIVESDGTIDTTGGWNGMESVAPFGDGGSWGQTFVAPAQHAILTGFSFWIERAPSDTTGLPIDFTAFVMAWDGDRATGSVLFQSPPQSVSEVGMQEFSFQTGELTLEPGQSYIAFLHASDFVGETPPLASVGFRSTDIYPQGQFWGQGTGPNFSNVTLNAWNPPLEPSADLVFRAVFDTGVPTGAGPWIEQAYIKTSNTDPGDALGPVALLEDTLVISAPGEDSGATGIEGDRTDNSAENAGAVYLFTRDGLGEWTEQAYIKASNTDPGDGFASVALTEDTIVIGAPNEASLAGGIGGDQSDNSATNGGAGAVYVFR